MKLLPILFLAFSLPLAAAVPPEVQQMLTEAQAAFTRGDMETAKADFEMVYKLDPRNQVAISFLRRIKSEEGTHSKGNDQEKQLAALVLPRVEFKEATLGATLDFLRKAVEKQSDGKLAVNFVVQVPDEQVKAQPVTLSLTNVPFTEVLRYLGGVAGLTFVYDKYAIIVKPAVAPRAAQ